MDILNNIAFHKQVTYSPITDQNNIEMSALIVFRICSTHNATAIFKFWHCLSNQQEAGTKIEELMVDLNSEATKSTWSGYQGNICRLC
jgi:hypothetical protein